MELDKYTAQLRENLIAAAALGDEKTQATAAALAAATESSARLVLLAALSDLAAEVSAALEDRTVRVTMDGAAATVDVRKNTTADEPPTIEEMTGDISRVTLRLVEQMKAKAEEAAAASGVSLNSWMSNAVYGALRDQMRGPGPRRDPGPWRDTESTRDPETKRED
ncbi:toxin-antitoxin system HicB family antitoxin [Nocardia puris]|uniref:HicB-like protein involved in pilus formation n=1 Tax=Nocardia puris TaxID=208602 RepID=A0A366E2H3_9NOCA|nr:toxin-antitoxin system HicB family antitoxin [Nocardia puris]MBF6212613.1 toxin-antitoxin system HicB family antitoxin [Nocardia puris]MBF6369193.1 toxin-antitoxin system HicB family antitoxin [Nocardia puris]MBF6461202.1 toxin-antitoxin system HicB family antitoxin [Nocardia puris]RBO96570.1 HicB-like protein involved in pilus formation [Nocardia puris]